MVRVNDLCGTILKIISTLMTILRYNEVYIDDYYFNLKTFSFVCALEEYSLDRLYQQPQEAIKNDFTIVMFELSYTYKVAC